MGLSKVSIELDCKQVIDDISRRLNTSSLFGAIIDICKTSLGIYQNLKISFIKRQAYSVVHLLARASLSYTSSHNFKISFIRIQAYSVTHLLARESLSYVSSHIHDHIPSCIEIFIINEMS